MHNPEEIIIQQSQPFRMRKPGDQADFFRLLSKVLYYIVSGNSRVGFLAAQQWNPYFVAVKGGKKPEDPDRGRHRPEVCKTVVPADFQTRPMYDCIEVRPYGEKQILVEASFMDAEGVLDDESDVEDDDLDEDELRKAELKYGSAAGYVMEGSPMDIS